MEMNEYQRKALKTYKMTGYLYVTLGLCGEAGEVAEKVKKLLRDSGGTVTDEFRESLKKELGDVLWYLSVLSHEFGIDFDSVAVTNIEKLASRADRNMIHGNGDDR